MSTPRRLRQVSVVAVSAIAVITLSACSSAKPTDSSNSVVWGGTGEPDTLDPAYATAGVAWQPDEQLYEGLVTTSEDGTAIEPALATKWSGDAAATGWTFTLRKGVTFHDGTPFNAAAVCTNFDRWYNFSGVQQSSGVSYWYQSVFGGFKRSESDTAAKPLFRSCAVLNDNTVKIVLNRPSASFVPALSMVPFYMASPSAMKKYDADKIGGTEGAPNLQTPFGTEHPIGTGPYELAKWQKGQQIELKAYSKYWGDKAQAKRVVIRNMSDSTARLQALQAGSIDGYDSVPASDIAKLQSNSKATVHQASPVTVGYVGFNSAAAPLDNPKVREAIATAIDRDAVVKSMFSAKSAVATQLTPKALAGYDPSVPTKLHNATKAKQLVSGLGKSDRTITFSYPTGISRPYMPNPTAIFQAFQSDLESAGFTVKPNPITWTDYASQLLAGKLEMYLWGSVGSYPSASYFLDLYSSQTKLPAALAQTLSEQKRAADAEQDDAARAKLYQKINGELMRNTVAVPFVEPPIVSVMSKRVSGYTADPFGKVDFARLKVGR